MSKVILKESKAISKYVNISSHDYYLFSKDLFFWSFLVLADHEKKPYNNQKKAISKNTGKNLTAKLIRLASRSNKGVHIQLASHESESVITLQEIDSIILDVINSF